MKNLIVLCLLVLLVTSCTKNEGTVTVGTSGNPTGTSTFKPDNFTFGEYEYEHMSNDLIAWGYYAVSGNKISRSYRAEGGSNVYSPAHLMPDSTYAIIKPLIDSFPQYLLDHPNTSIGCIKCPNRQVLDIFSVTGADTTRWTIAIDTALTMPELKPYAQQMMNVWSKLYSIQ